MIHNFLIYKRQHVDIYNVVILFKAFYWTFYTVY